MPALPKSALLREVRSAPDAPPPTPTRQSSGSAATIAMTIEGLREILGWSEITPRLALFAVVIWPPFVVTIDIFKARLKRDRVSPTEGILLVLFAVGAAYGMQWMYHRLRRQEAAAVPDVILRFVNPKQPELGIINDSDAYIHVSVSLG